MPLAVNGDLLATINGSELYVCNRYNGDLLYQNKIAGSPNGSPALSDDLSSFPPPPERCWPIAWSRRAIRRGRWATEQEGAEPEEKQAAETYRRENLRLRQDHIDADCLPVQGTVLCQPLVTRQDREEEIIAWPTDRGILSVARIDRRDLSVMTAQVRVEDRRGHPCQARPTGAARPQSPRRCGRDLRHLDQRLRLRRVGKSAAKCCGSSPPRDRCTSRPP